MLNGKELNFSQYIFMNIYTSSYHFYLPKIQIMKKLLRSPSSRATLYNALWAGLPDTSGSFWPLSSGSGNTSNTPCLLPRMDGCQPFMRVVDLRHDATPFALGGRHYERNHFESLVDTNIQTTIQLFS